LRWGVYVVFEAPSEYVRACFDEYGLMTDISGNYATQWKPYHLIGLELGISVASVALRNEPTGSPTGFRGDAVATAKRDLKPGDALDGEGGFTVYGKLMPAAASLAAGALPIGLAHGVTLKNAVAKDQTVGWADVEIDANIQAVQVRRKMEAMFADPAAVAAQ
jgi:predicted homoserine dehydrogenase-like protein